MDTTFVDKINYVANWNKITLIMEKKHQMGMPYEDNKNILLLVNVAMFSP